MKILNIPEQYEIDLGSYGPACEGFIDAVKSLFAKKDKKQERIETLKKSSYKVFDALKKELENDLRQTYDKQGWVEKKLSNNSGFVTIPALTKANFNGEELTKPVEMIKIAREMMKVLNEIAVREKPFIEFRRKLTAQVDKMTDPKEVDALWEQYAKELSVSPVDRFRAKYKKPFPAFGHSTTAGGSCWPVSYKNLKDDEFGGDIAVKTSGKIEMPSVANAKQFADAIRALMEMCLETEKISHDNYISYWDSIEVNYDDLQYGDEIFSCIYSNQGTREVCDLAIDIKYTFGHIIAGLYIAMFDKHNTAKPANEGLLDFLRGKGSSKKNDQAEETAEMERVYAWLKENLHNGKLRSDLVLHGRSIQLSPTRSKLFFKKGESPDSIDALIHGWLDDLATLKKLFNSAKVDAKKAGDVVNGLEKALEKLVTNNRDVEWDQYRAEILKFKGKLPAPTAEKYQHYPHVFFGNTNPGLVEDNKPSGEFHHGPLNQKDIDNLVILAKQFSELWIQVSEVNETLPAGIDCTDWPFRQFAEEIWDDSETNSIISAMDGVSGTFRDNHALPIEFVEERASAMEMAVWNLIRAAYE